MCMYIYIYIFVWICVMLCLSYRYIYIYICTYTHTHIHIYTHVDYTQIYRYIIDSVDTMYIYIYICSYICSIIYESSIHWLRPFPRNSLPLALRKNFSPVSPLPLAIWRLGGIGSGIVGPGHRRVVHVLHRRICLFDMD